MKVIICLDDNQGMLFNKRRQSRDRKVTEDICKMTDKLWVSPFSEKLFDEVAIELCISERYLEEAGDGEYCFVEVEMLTPHLHKIEEVIVYRWNRKYPADVCLDIKLQDLELAEQSEFAGFSHEKITKEIYVRR